MIHRLIASALRFRILVIAGVCLLVAAGAWAVANLTVDAFPDLTPNQVDVLTLAPGLSPNEVENLVTYPLETSMMGLPRTMKVQSVSKAGISVVTVSFEDDVDLLRAGAGAAAHAGRDGCVARRDQADARSGGDGDGRNLSVLVESDSLSLIELKNIQEVRSNRCSDDSRASPTSAPGAPGAGIPGAGRSPAVVCLWDLAGRRAPDGRENNANFGAGYVEAMGQRLTIRGLGRVAHVADIENTMIATRPSGTPSSSVMSRAWSSDRRRVRAPCPAMAGAKRCPPKSSCSRDRTAAR
jgi:cobalt-zinc-cadmium resistance protein CzcA